MPWLNPVFLVASASISPASTEGKRQDLEGSVRSRRVTDILGKGLPTDKARFHGGTSMVRGALGVFFSLFFFFLPFLPSCRFCIPVRLLSLVLG